MTSSVLTTIRWKHLKHLCDCHCELKKDITQQLHLFFQVKPGFFLNLKYCVPMKVLGLLAFIKDISMQDSMLNSLTDATLNPLNRSCSGVIL